MEKEEFKDVVLKPQDEKETDLEVAGAEETKQQPKKKKVKVDKKTVELEKAKEDIKNLKEAHLRCMAEMENIKRRNAEEKMRDKKYRAQPLIADLIPVLDNFERALAIKTDNKEVNNFIVGMKMVCDLLITALANEGVTIIEPKIDEEFDAKIHEAISAEEVTGKEAGFITEVLGKGYMLKDRVVKPATVKVSL